MTKKKQIYPPGKSFTPQQEAIAITLRKHSQFSIKECSYILKPFIPHPTKSSL